jgi:magnesium-transporting ATPase (P-type)
MTYLSRVELTGDVGKSSSTLKADIEYFVKVLTAFALFQAALVFIVGIARGLDPIQGPPYHFLLMLLIVNSPYPHTLFLSHFFSLTLLFFIFPLSSPFLSSPLPHFVWQCSCKASW